MLFFVNVGLTCPKCGMLLIMLLELVWSTLPAVPSTCLDLVGVEQNANQQPNVVNIRKSVFLHAGVMQIIGAMSVIKMGYPDMYM